MKAIFLAQCALLFIALPPAMLRAQVPSAPRPSGNPEDETLLLSPFVVTGEGDEVGYRALNSLTALRIRTPIMDTPFNIKVITGELLEDTNAAWATDTLERYVAGIVGGDQGLGTLRIRGKQSEASLRNGFLANLNTPSILVDRVEMLSGSAAVLYGISWPGGMLNTVTKRAHPEQDEYRLSGWWEVGSDAYHSWSIDANLGKTFDNVFGDNKFAVRLLARDRRGGITPKTDRVDPTEFDNLEDHIINSAYAATLTYRPFAGTEVRYEYSRARNKNPSGGNFLILRDQDTNPLGRRTRSEVPAQVLDPDIPWNWSKQIPPGDFNKHETHYVVLEQSVGRRLNFQAAYTAQVGNRDQQTQPSDLRPASAYRVPADIQAQLGIGPDDLVTRISHRARMTDLENSDWLLLGTYQFDIENSPVGRFGNTFLLSYQDSSSDFTRFERHPRATPGLPLGRALEVFAPMAVVDFWEISAQQGVPLSGRGGWVRAPGNQIENYDYRTATGVYQGRFFEEQVFLNSGLVRIDYESVSVNRINNSTGATEPRDRDPLTYNTAATSPWFGLLYRPVPWLSLFGSYAESLIPETAVNGFGRPLSPPTGEGLEFGVKLDLLDGKISGTISYYQTDFVNDIVTDPDAHNSDTAVLNPDGSITPLPDFDPNDLGAASNLGASVYRGVDVDLIFTPTRAWQTIFSYAYQDPYIKSNPGSPETVGDMPDRTAHHYVSFWSRYNVLSGRAQGLSLALGFKWDSGTFDRVVEVGDTRTRRIRPSVIRASEARIAYTQHLGRGDRYRVTWSLNINNLLDRDDPRGGFKATDGTVASTEVFTIPSYGRRYTFKTDLSF